MNDKAFIKEVVKESLAEVFDERDRIDSVTHKEDHDWTQAQRKKAASWAAFWEEMRKHLIRWGIFGAISVIGYALIYYLKHHIFNGGS